MIYPPDTHKPRNEACGHNHDPNNHCTCPTPKHRNRKGYKICRVTDSHAPHSVSPDIVLEIHGNGVLVFREKRKRKSYSTTAGAIFASLVWKDARQQAQAKKSAKRKK
jgi:hypothetical protein